MPELSDFQIVTEAQLTDQLAAQGLAVVERQVKGESEVFIEGRVEDVRFWIYVDGACIIGRDVDRVFEKWDFDSPADLRTEFVGQLVRLVSPPGSTSPSAP